jgi:hypothetical protein
MIGMYHDIQPLVEMGPLELTAHDPPYLFLSISKVYRLEPL